MTIRIALSRGRRGLPPRWLWAYLVKDAVMFGGPWRRSVVAWCAGLLARVLRTAGRWERAHQLAALSYRMSDAPWVLDQAVAVCQALADRPLADDHRGGIDDRDQVLRLVGSRMLVVQPWRPGHRGVLVIDYSYTFPLVASWFDMSSLLRRYWLVLEPSWNGLPAKDILMFASFREPIFVQTNEPRDQATLRRISPWLVPVPIAANWWLDTDAPPPLVSTEYDLIMVASWARFKNHWAFLRELRRIIEVRPGYRVCFVGYDQDLGVQQIRDLVSRAGLDQNVTLFHRLSQREVRELLAKSSVHVLWSRFEGSNRAIIEALAADVPIILRKGFNFGHHYDFVNAATGAFAADGELASVVDELERRSVAPRAWVREHIGARQAAEALGRAIQKHARSARIEWEPALVPKVSALDAQRYLPPIVADHFAKDYAFIRSCLNHEPRRQ